jgi:hypothetical protein
MAIPDAFKPTPIPALDSDVPIVDPQTGIPTIQFLQAYERFRQYVNGSNRVIPCSASTTSNVITLTPNDATPLLEGYRDYDVFIFEADATSTGDVTATVVPKTGSLATIKVFKTDGAAQATTGDIVSGSLYLFCFVDALDSGAGGLVAK